jgi:endonuclease-3 related protein
VPVFLTIYKRLLQQLGPSHWWPAESPFEVIVGAILTPNPSWKNVEKALACLRAATDLRPEKILALSQEDLAQLIRSSGYYNQKALRLHGFLRWFEQFDFSVASLRASAPPEELRRNLLALKVIGKETADSILCYALGLPFFVVDAYTFRLIERLKLDIPRQYDAVRLAVESEFRLHHAEAELTAHLNEFHALIVRHGNTLCRKQNPLCSQCILRQEEPSKGLTSELHFRSCRYDAGSVREYL